ncbi:MAG: PilZ domain-containing protein [Deltaproteobacteria bacterium]|nr:PilZ domain-containing protein [Deltaproteobacteria bacterium]
MTEGPNVRERRVDINVEFDSLSKLLSEYLTNLSRTGAFIQTREPWPVGTRLRLRFTVLADDPEILEGSAEVVRVSETPPGMGVAFLELTESSKALIDKILKRRPAKRNRTQP